MAITAQDYFLKATKTESLTVRVTLAEVFLTTASNHPEAVAVSDGGHEFTWRQWQDKSYAVARGLQDELGVQPGDVVAAHLPNCMDFLVLHVAVAMVGAVFQPVHMDSSQDDLVSLLRRTTPVVLVISANDGGYIRERLPDLGYVLVADDEPDSLAELAQRWAGSKPNTADVSPDTPCVLMTSSGTRSKRPKICIHSHQRVLENAITVVTDGISVATNDAMLSCSPLSFSFGLLSLHISILAGARQVLLRKWTVGGFMSAMRSNQPTILYAAPTQLRDILAGLSADENLPRLREIRTGGTRVPEDLVLALTSALADQVTV